MGTAQHVGVVVVADVRLPAGFVHDAVLQYLQLLDVAGFPHDALRLQEDRAGVEPDD